MRKSKQKLEILERAKHDLVNGVEPGKWTGADVAALEAVYVATLTPPPATFTPAEIEQALRDRNLTDAGNAECLAMLHGETLRYCHELKKWLFWDGARWQVDTDSHAARLMLETIRERYKAGAKIEDTDKKRKFASFTVTSENARKMRDGLSVAQFLQPFSTRITQYDRNPGLAAAGDKTIDLSECAARESRRDDYITLALGGDYNPDAKCPQWLKFLGEVFGGDQDLIAYVQRAIGYSLTGDTREQCIFLCHGAGANGKSTMLAIMGKLLGDYAGTASFETFDADRRSEASNDLAALRGKRLVTIVETDEDRRLAEARVKAVTGGDMITCRFLYGEFFTYRPAFKIWLAMNHKPMIRGTDNGIWRRIHLIPFSQSFTSNPDRNLERKLTSELAGILNWALEGLREWGRQGLNPPEIVRKATQEYRMESDYLAQWLSERTITREDATTPAKDLYEDYCTWATENGYNTRAVRNGDRPISMTAWGRRMTEKGFQRLPNTSRKVYIGIGLLAKEGAQL